MNKINLIKRDIRDLDLRQKNNLGVGDDDYDDGDDERKIKTNTHWPRISHIYVIEEMTPKVIIAKVREISQTQSPSSSTSTTTE